MIRYKSEINQLLNVFNKSTGIGAICFDKQLNVIAYTPSKSVVNDYYCLGMSCVTSFVAEKFLTSPAENQEFYTYILEPNLYCNIVFIVHDNEFLGALITQPILINKLSQRETEELIGRLHASAEAQKSFRSILFGLPAASYDQLMQIGKVLFYLTQNLFAEKTVRQVLCGGPEDNASDVSHKAFSGGAPEKNLLRHGSFSDYIKIKDCIQRGDADALRELMDNIHEGIGSMKNQNAAELRALKDNLIKNCSMCCYAAIEAGASYYKMMDLEDEHIRKIEALDNIGGIYELTQNTLISFAKAVAASRGLSYSKPVRQVLEYIFTNYHDKISLEQLAEIANLSPPYLSTLIKKETGLSLMDNINKIRIDQSKKLLINTNEGILGIANKVGFLYQNHYASVFKKFSGCSPTEFRASMGGSAHKQKKSGNFPSEDFPPAIEQLRNKFSMLDGMFDDARIVDPVSHKAWPIHSDDAEAVPETCYSIWNTEGPCKNCVSALSLMRNEAFLKLDYRFDDTIMVMAIPKKIGGRTYVVEIIKNISQKMVIETNGGKPDLPPDSANYKDGITELFNRQYIDEFLPICAERSKSDKRPFSIILIQAGDIETIMSFDPAENDLIFQKLADIMTSSTKSMDAWSGRYAGNVFLTALYADEKKAAATAKNIKEEFKKRMGKKSMALVCVIKTLSDEVPDAETLVKSAFVKLHSSVTGT